MRFGFQSGLLLLVGISMQWLWTLASRVHEVRGATQRVLEEHSDELMDQDGEMQTELDEHRNRLMNHQEHQEGFIPLPLFEYRCLCKWVYNETRQSRSLNGWKWYEACPTVPLIRWTSGTNWPVPDDVQDPVQNFTC